MKEILLRAPATVANFGPGFDIFALALKEPYDILKIRLNEAKSITIKITGGAEDLPVSAERNTAGLAALQFLEKMNLSTGIDVEIKKGMKTGSGLGSSGASAVSCIYGLNRLLNTGLGHNEIIDIARKGEIASGRAAHADNVAACLMGGFVLIKNYKPIEVMKIDIPDIPIVICVMKKARQTSRDLISNSLGLTKALEQMSSCALLVHAIASGDLERIGEAVNRDHISEPTRSKFIPAYYEIKKKVLEAGAFGCNISGGGSSIFAICEENKTGEIAEIMTTLSSQTEVESDVIVSKSSNTGITEIDGL